MSAIAARGVECFLAIEVSDCRGGGLIEVRRVWSVEVLRDAWDDSVADGDGLGWEG